MESTSSVSVTSISLKGNASVKSSHSCSSTSYRTSLENEPKPKQKHKLYGDIVNALMLAVGAPFFANQMYAEGGIGNFEAVVLVSTISLSAVCQGLAWSHGSLVLSRLGFLGNCFAGSYMGKQYESNRIGMK